MIHNKRHHKSHSRRSPSALTWAAIYLKMASRFLTCKLIKITSRKSMSCATQVRQDFTFIRATLDCVKRIIYR